MVSWFSIKLPRQFNGERRVFSTNSARPTVYPDIKERSCSFISQQTKVTQYGSKTWHL